MKNTLHQIEKSMYTTVAQQNLLELLEKYEPQAKIYTDGSKSDREVGFGIFLFLFYKKKSNQSDTYGCYTDPEESF
jgi:hypothetical protein